MTQITNSTGNLFVFSPVAPQIDAAGDRIAFQSNTNLLGTNSEGNFEIFLWDAVAGITQITNTTSGISTSPAINAAGDRIAFQSNANLLGSNGDGNTEVFLWDASTGVAQITSTSGGSSSSPAINAAGDRIAFVSSADLLGSNADGNFEVFLWEAGTGLTQITHATSGDSFAPAINADGKRIAFLSSADLTGSNLDGNLEIFFWDAATGLTQLTSTSSFFNFFSPPAIDADGNRIAFAASADLTGGNGDKSGEIFLWDAATSFRQITSSPDGVVNTSPSIDADGNRIAFISFSPGISLRILLWDAFTGFTQVVDATGGNTDSPRISASGTHIAFESNLDFLGTNGDHNREAFLASCALPIPLVPAVSPLGLGTLACLLGIAAAWTLRMRRERD